MNYILMSIHWKQIFKHIGENMVKRTRDAKVKVLFQILHMTHVIFVSVYNLKFIFNLTLHIRYKYVLITNWFYIIYIMHSQLLHKCEQLLLRPTFSKSIIFKVKNMFKPNVLKSIINSFFISSNLFALLIINV